MPQDEKPLDVGAYDNRMVVARLDGRETAWRTARQAPFVLEGFPWFPRDGLFRRLPSDPPEALPEAVDNLANCTAGGRIRFRTDSPDISVRVKLPRKADMMHMPATGQCGVDCYLGEPGEERFAAVTKYDPQASEYACPLLKDLPRSMRTVTLHFPLYMGVSSLEVGLAPDASVEPPPPRPDDGRVAIYGTSITQGGCASRSGMAYPNILARRLNREVVNLGFSGSGRGEPEVARTIATMERPGLFVLDYVANCGDPARYAATLPAFVRILRETHSDTPILILSTLRYARETFQSDAAPRRCELADIGRRVTDELTAAGEGGLHFHDMSGALGDDFDECTVDGVHPTDLGFLRMANELTPVLRRVLADT